MTSPFTPLLTPSWRRWGRRRRRCRGRWWWWRRWRWQRGRRRWWWWLWWKWQRWRRRWWWLRWPLFCWHLPHWVRHKVVTIIDALSSSSSSNNYCAAAFALHSALLFIHFLHHQGQGGGCSPPSLLSHKLRHSEGKSRRINEFAPIMSLLLWETDSSTLGFLICQTLFLDLDSEILAEKEQ